MRSPSAGRRAEPAADRLLVWRVRRGAPADGPVDGAVRVAQPRGGDEQPAGAGSGRGRRHEPDVPELRTGAVGRDLLHVDDPRARGQPSHALASGLQAHGVSASSAHAAANVPPVSILFAAFLGYNPIEHLIGAHALSGVSAANHAALTGRSFFPHLISAPFSSGLHEAFIFAIVACLIAAAASLARGGRYHYADAASKQVNNREEPQYAR